jgi:hypothetical protein
MPKHKFSENVYLEKLFKVVQYIMMWQPKISVLTYSGTLRKTSVNTTHQYKTTCRFNL